MATKKTKKQGLVDRLKNPLFIAAMAGVAYQVLAKYGKAPTFEEFQLWVDLASYVLIGGGVYSRFAPKE